MPLFFTLALVIVAVVVVVALARANEIFCVSVRNGQCLIVRGRVSPALWREIRAVVRQSRIRSGTIRAVRERGRHRIVVSGMSDAIAQRLRNALGNTGFGQGKGASGGASDCENGGRNLGQLLGIAWLAWLFVRR